MPDTRPEAIAIEYGLLAVLVSIAAITALEAGAFVVAGLCLIGSLVCSHRTGRLVTLRLQHSASREATD
ncbi:MAG: Flp family type IVb pilin [Kiloniellaceae bacterium]